MADTKVVVTLRTKDGVKIGSYTMLTHVSAPRTAAIFADITEQGKGIIIPTREAGTIVITKDVASSLLYFVTEEPES